MLGGALCCEDAVLLVFNVVVLAKEGFSAFPLDSFAPSTVLQGAAGVSIMYAFSVFIGFEATAIYGEQACDPRKTVPRATYIAIAVISICYVITTWAAIASYGAGAAPVAKDPGNFLLNANETAVGSAQLTIMSFLLLSSLFAAYTAFSQAAARYTSTHSAVRGSSPALWAARTRSAERRTSR
jgi:amino acid transporter